MTEDEIADDLLGMGIGQVRRYGPAKVFRSDRETWLVVAGGTGKDFRIPDFAARWIALMMED